MTGYFSPDGAPKSVRSALGASARRGVLARVLRYGAPMVSVSALIWAAPALAQTTVTSSTSTPLVTSKTGDLTINSGVSVTPPSGVAVTIDSSNILDNIGVIKFQNLSGVTGVLANGGLTSNITNNGTIQVDDTSTPTTDSNGIQHGPFANGTDRIGIHVVGAGDFTGTVANAPTGVITVKGDNSYGIFIESNLAGILNNAGTLSATGTNVYGIRTTGTVSGDVTLGGTVGATGQNAQAVNLGGNIGGALVINGTITSTGYRYTTRSTDTNFLSRLTADDLLQSGATVTVGGGVAGGILVDTIVTDATTGTTTGSTGIISSIASAPALVVGGANPITIGNVGTGLDAFGIEIKGTVAGTGIYDHITSTAMQLGIAGGGTVDTGGGVRISGTVTASSYAADSTALHLFGGVIAPVLRNEGTIDASLITDAAGATATGLIIEPGANVPVLQNAATISASVAGEKANVAAIIDRSGTLVEIENIGQIASGRTLPDPSTVVTGQDVALDLRVNTTGVHLIQSTPTGDTLVPSITGSVTLGSGGDNVQILAGTLTGDVELGAGANTLAIDNGAVVKGALNATGGTVGLSVGTGTLQINNASQLKLTSLSLGPASSLVMTADPSIGLATNMNVAGAATIASGATIGLRFNSILPGATTYTLIRAGSLTSAAPASSMLGSVPYLYNATLLTDMTAGTVSAAVSLKSAAELALPATTAGAYQALIANIGRDSRLEGALLQQDNRPALLALYNQLMPYHSGSLFNLVAASEQSFAQPIADRQDPVGGGFWLQEVNLFLDANNQSGEPGYKGWSFGAVGGYEIPRTALGILGVTFGASTNQIYPDNTEATENLHATVFDAGVYWRMTSGGFSANARFSGDYIKVTSDRVVAVLGADGLAVNEISHARWSGLAFNGHAYASYEAHLGHNIYIRPQAGIDYIHMSEGAYDESGGGPGMDLAVGSVTNSRLTAFAGVAVGALYGPDKSWGPEATLGYQGVANEVLGATTAHYVAGGDAFTLRSDQISGQGLAARLSVKGENGSGGFALETGAEARDGLNIYDLRLTGHVQF
jgi:autotransporter-like protein